MNGKSQKSAKLTEETINAQFINKNMILVHDIYLIETNIFNKFEYNDELMDIRENLLVNNLLIS